MRLPCSVALSCIHSVLWQDKDVFNLVGTPNAQLPLQASVDKLANMVEDLKERGISKPFPYFEMKEFMPIWAREVR